jgi:TonB family protein
MALTSTGVERRAHLAEAASERVTFAELPLRMARSIARRSNAGGHRGRPGNVAPTLTPPELLLSFDLVLPDPPPLPDYLPDYRQDDFALEIAGTAGFADDVLHLGVGLATSPHKGANHGAYDEGAVEKRAMPVSTNLKPRYPSRMLSRGIETNFAVYFVVDSTGIVEQSTIELPPSVQEEFASAVTEVLSSWRFAPAEVGGRRVRQRVLQPFTFRLERRFSSLTGP